MCLALLRLDFAAAWRANAGLLLLLPALAVLLVGSAHRYVKTGITRLTRKQNVMIWVMVGYLLVYGVARNLPFISYLAPQ